MATLKGLFGAAITYSHPVALTVAGAPAPALEGEIRSPTGGPPKRFGLVALVRGGCKANALYFGPREGFLPKFYDFARRISLSRSGGDPRTPASNEHQAACLSIDLPEGWIYPRQLSFQHAAVGDARLRVSIAEPLATEGSISLERELPAQGDDRIVILNSTVTPDGRSGWCRFYPPADVVTAHFIAQVRDAGALSSAWSNFVHSMRERRHE
jgi:hypothetical protein